MSSKPDPGEKLFFSPRSSPVISGNVHTSQISVHTWITRGRERQRNRVDVSESPAVFAIEFDLYSLPIRACQRN